MKPTAVMMESYFKICLLGDSGVGKTSLFNFLQHQDANGIPLAEMETHVRLGRDTYPVMIWDTAGQEAFKATVSGYLRNANAVILMFDVTKKTTFDNLPQWFEMAKNANADHYCEIVVVGNKIDLYYKREVLRNAADAYSVKNGMKFWETSVIWGKNIDIVLETIVHDILRSQSLAPFPKSQDIIRLSNRDGADSGCISKLTSC